MIEHRSVEEQIADLSVEEMLERAAELRAIPFETMTEDEAARVARELNALGKELRAHAEELERYKRRRHLSVVRD
jgi:antitoxin component of RelBE/YafQ-DinJ toxin-antitoxin module